jgi:hypothetical protein
MFARCLQILSLALLCTSASGAAAAPLQPGGVYDLSFRDVDGEDLATADGHVTIITVTARAGEQRARAVAQLVPERYIGDPKYRYITLVDFEGKVPSAVRGITRAVIRRRLDAEARLLKPRYDAKKLTRDPRKDVYVVADFDGNAVAKLGLLPGSADVKVFIFDSRGKLVARWDGMPPEPAFVQALSRAT